MPKKNISSLSLAQLLSAYLPVIIWAGAIFLFSSQRSLHSFQLDTLDFIIKKTAHMGEYFLLFFLVHRALNMTHHKNYPANWLIALIVCIAYAASDEWHQSFVTGRTASLRDVGFDSLGVSIAFLRIYRYI
jgi:VanZ family protein